MIKITNKIRNNHELYNVVQQMNQYDKGLSCRKCRSINFSRLTFSKGYTNLLRTMSELKTFTWEDLILMSNYRKNVIYNYGDKPATFHKRVTNYMNCYKTFFRNYGIIKSIGNKKHGRMAFTELGSKLCDALFVCNEHDLKGLGYYDVRCNRA